MFWKIQEMFCKFKNIFVMVEKIYLFELTHVLNLSSMIRIEFNRIMW